MSTPNNTHFDAFQGATPTPGAFLTRAAFTREQAAAALPHADTAAAFGQHPGESALSFGGHIVTSTPGDWKEAARIVAARGFGETVDGILRPGYNPAAIPAAPNRFA